ncbi:hypothetical protein ACLMJK_002181 [Lecanora helva]
MLRPDRKIAGRSTEIPPKKMSELAGSEKATKVTTLVDIEDLGDFAIACAQNSKKDSNHTPAEGAKCQNCAVGSFSKKSGADSMASTGDAIGDKVDISQSSGKPSHQKSNQKEMPGDSKSYHG